MKKIMHLDGTAAQPQFQTVDIQGPNGKLVADIYRPDLKDGQKINLIIQMHGFKAYEQITADKVKYYLTKTVRIYVL